MTIEEAIRELKIIRGDFWDDYSDSNDPYAMAIKALEQLSDNPISREEIER